MTKNQKIKEAARFGRRIDFWRFVLHWVIKIGDTARGRIKQYTEEQDTLLNEALFNGEKSSTAKHEFKSRKAES